MDNLEMRTVTFKGDADTMGVVVYDGGGERVRVDFGFPETDEAGRPGEWVNRDDLTDVTDVYDMAKGWGYTEEGEE